MESVLFFLTAQQLACLKCAAADFSCAPCQIGSTFAPFMDHKSSLAVLRFHEKTTFVKALKKDLVYVHMSTYIFSDFPPLL